MTPNEIILLIILIAVILGIICFLAVFIIEHFSSLSVYERNQIKIHFQEDELKGQEIILVKECKGKKGAKDNKKVGFYITAKEMLEVLETIEAKRREQGLVVTDIRDINDHKEKEKE